MKFCSKRVIPIALVLLVLFSLGVVSAQAQDDRPRLRAVNASLRVPSADVYVNDTLYFQDVYYSYVSNYVPVDQGERSLKVRPAGVKEGGDLVVGGSNFEAGKDYTMLILETSVWVIEDDNKGPLAPGQTRVRMVNASQGPAVEICLDDQCEILTHAKIGGYLILDAGNYNLEMRLVGTDEYYSDVLPITFQSGEVYSIFIMDPKQGEIRPRIIPHADTGQQFPQPPGPPGQPPFYPPVTGAFLSPTALIIVLVVMVVALIGGFWIVRRQFTKA